MSQNLIIIILAIVLVLALFFIFFLYLTNRKGNGRNSELDNLYKQISGFESRVFDNIKNIDQKLSSSEREMKRVVENQFENSKDLISDISERMTNSERETRKTLQVQFSEANKLIQEITGELVSVKEGNKQVFSMTEQLSNLEKVLTNQKQRGNWGEGSLELILSNIINTHFTMQYKFTDGDIVDAVVHIKDKLLPIDSKFSLDNYQRCIDAEIDEDKKYYAEEFKKDIKKRIDETSKYIKEKENTLSIAFMFIPSEAIYYDLLAGEQSRIKVNTQKLIEYAQAQKVFIVSPTSILAYLHLVLSGIKAFTIEESAKQIQKKVEELGKHVAAHENYMKKLGNSLGTTVNHYTDAYKELKKIDKDVYKITDGVSGGSIEVMSIDKPNLED